MTQAMTDLHRYIRWLLFGKPRYEWILQNAADDSSSGGTRSKRAGHFDMPSWDLAIIPVT